MPVNVITTNLLAGAGELYRGAFGVAEPADPTAAPGVGLIPVGATQGGLTWTISQTIRDREVDQIRMAPGGQISKEEVTLATSLAEPTLNNLKLVLNGGTVTDETTFESYEPEDATGDAAPDYSALFFYGQAPGLSKKRLVILRKVLSVDSVGQEYKKDGDVLLPVTFRAYWVSSSIKPYIVMDEK